MQEYGFFSYNYIPKLNLKFFIGYLIKRQNLEINYYLYILVYNVNWLGTEKKPPMNWYGRWRGDKMNKFTLVKNI